MLVVLSWLGMASSALTFSMCCRCHTSLKLLSRGFGAQTGEGSPHQPVPAMLAPPTLRRIPWPASSRTRGQHGRASVASAEEQVVEELLPTLEQSSG